MVKRRVFLTGLGSTAVGKAAPLPSETARGVRKSTSGLLPRKVIVGTAMQSFWGRYPGLEKRLEQLAAIIDRMVQVSKSRYGRGLDLAILPEAAITGEVGDDALSRSVAFEGPVGDTFMRTAREHRCYC